ncbi:MAG: TetR/AcrR family transcriptional regulator [Chloroflexi bacterium]|nr:MAG: TetR/AcrR family transcriptional regulator [Chloroflexota bacterium]
MLLCKIEKEDVNMQLEGRPMRENILAAAVQLFAEYGYHAAPLRDIARLAGIQAASIYHHYPNKQSLLVEIMETYMRRLNSRLEQILHEYHDPHQRLQAAITNHIQLHTSYKAEFFIIDTEMRAVEVENRAYILSLRDTYDALLQELLTDGMERGVFRATDVKVTSYAIIAMCTQVATWFRHGGRLSVQQVIDIYCQMITQGLLSTQDVEQQLEGSAHI